MKPIFTLALLLLVQGSLYPKPPPADDKVVEKIWADFPRLAWDTPIRDWVGAGSIGTGLECQEHQGDSYDTRPDTEWSFRCVKGDSSHTSEWFFYALPDVPLTCRLERLQLTATDSPLPDLEKIHQALETHLDGRYGPGREPERQYGGYGEFKSAYWRQVRLWETSEVQIYLYILDTKFEPPTLGVLARHRHLVDAIARGRQRPYWWRSGPWSAQRGNPADQELAKELDAEFPGLEQMLLREPKPDTVHVPSQETQRFLKLLLVAARESSPERRPALLLAAVRLAQKFQPASPADRDRGRIQLEFGGYELNYLWSHLGWFWAYQGDLLWQVWREHGKSVWGEMAFVMLLNQGWDTKGACGLGSDEFRHVIKQAEQFLGERPESPYRKDVMFMLAQAYETWWSLNRASIQDSYVDRFQYIEGADKAREKAIELYESIIQTDAEGYAADYARQRLPRLKLSLDTNQRRFFCIYD